MLLLHVLLLRVGRVGLLLLLLLLLLSVGCGRLGGACKYAHTNIS
jgi:hypothetical protein